MKQLYLTGIIILCTISAFSQITLEHTYSSSVQPVWIDGSNSVYYDTYPSSSVKIWDIDHNLVKNISLPQFTDNVADGVNSVTTQLFDSDPSTYELMVYYFDTMTFNTVVRIIRDDGTVLKEFTGMPFIGVYYTITSDGPKLIALYSDFNSNPITYSSEVYSLPGEIYLTAPDGPEEVYKASLPYPNPTSGEIKIPVENDASKVMVYNLTGKLMETRTDIQGGKEITLSPVFYHSGNYFYQVISKTGKVIQTGKFIVK